MKAIVLSAFFAITVLVSIPNIQYGSVYAQTTQWTWSSITVPSCNTTNAMHLDLAKHSGNLVIAQATMPYVRVDYLQPDPDITIYDQICSDHLAGSPAGPTHFDSHAPSSGTTYYHAIFYVGPCNANNWPQEGCYKYEQFYQFVDSTGTSKAQFMHFLKIYGNGYTGTYGTPIYNPFWRLDTDIIDAGNDKYEVYTSGWSLVQYETSLVNDSTHGEDNTEWRTYDNNQGVSKRMGIMSPSVDNGKIWIIRWSTGERDGPPEPDSFVNSGVSVVNQDDVYWYKATRSASTTCKSTSPCMTGPTLYLTGL